MDSLRKRVSGMVFIITGAAESDRDTTGRLLAEALGWEFVDAADLHFPGKLDATTGNSPLAGADRILPMGILPTAINFWVYEWRDVVVSCPELGDRDRRQLSEISSLVKIVCLEAVRAGMANSQSPACWRPARDHEQAVLTLDSSRLVEEIIAELTAGVTT